MVLPLELMIPGPGVQTPEVGVGEVGSVQLISVEKVPSHCVGWL